MLGKGGDNVQSLDNEIEFLNILASSLSLVHKGDLIIGEIDAASNYLRYAQYIKDKADLILVLDDSHLLKELKHILKEIEESKGEEGLIYAIEFCKWLDFHITYVKKETDSKNGERQYVSLYHLIDIETKQVVHIGALNTNYKDTKIWINPKLQVSTPYVMREGNRVEQDVSNRDVFEGINGILKNCCYFIFDGKTYISNVILPSDFFPNEKFLRIGFSPLSNRSDNLNIEYIDWVRKGIQQQGIAMGPIACSEEIKQRFCEDFKTAGDNNVNILFAPEMLGVEAMESTRGRKNKTIYELSIERQEQFLTVPEMIVLPSYWSGHFNTVTITDGTGEILGKQEKHIPYIDRKNHFVEALQESERWNTVLVHIPQKLRIAIMICAEFLNGKKEKIFDLICGSLCTSLIIVPSYSTGEKDFINALSSLKMYGTTVVWGNCCGAIRPDEKAIGGCGIAGTKLTDVFGRVCNCGNSCDNVKSCIFAFDIPLDYEYMKNANVNIVEIKHIVEKIV